MSVDGLFMRVLGGFSLVCAVACGEGGPPAGVGTLTGELAFPVKSAFVQFHSSGAGVDADRRYVRLTSVDFSGYCWGDAGMPPPPYKVVSLYIAGTADGGVITSPSNAWVLYWERLADGGTAPPPGTSVEGELGTLTLSRGDLERTAGTFSVDSWYASSQAVPADGGLSLAGTFDARSCDRVDQTSP